jgi:hypothetical protein
VDFSFGEAVIFEA